MQQRGDTVDYNEYVQFGCSKSSISDYISAIKQASLLFGMSFRKNNGE